jgi:predicted membrane protein
MGVYIMKNTVTRATCGFIFILLGLSLAGKALGIFDFNIFFRGWWTLFIIIPCAIGLIERENRSASGIGLCFGVLLLLSAQGVFHWYMFSRLFIALLFIAIGYMIIMKGSRKQQTNYHYSNSKESSNSNQSFNNDSDNNGYGNQYNNQYSNQNNNQYGNQYSNQNSDQNGSSNYSGTSSDSYSNTSWNNNTNQTNSFQQNGYNNTSTDRTNHGGNNHFSSILGGRNIQYSEEIFTGAVISSILGNMQLDLRKAIFNRDAVIDTTCILGGIDIFVPANVRVMVNCTPILGGVDNKAIPPYEKDSSSYTIFINGTCILGGVVVK